MTGTNNGEETIFVVWATTCGKDGRDRASQVALPGGQEDYILDLAFKHGAGRDQNSTGAFRQPSKKTTAHAPLQVPHRIKDVKNPQGPRPQ